MTSAEMEKDKTPCCQSIRCSGRITGNTETTGRNFRVADHTSKTEEADHFEEKN